MPHATMKKLKDINLLRTAVNGNVLSNKCTHIFQCNGYRLNNFFFSYRFLDSQASWNNLMGRVKLLLIIETMFLQHSLTSMSLYFKVQGRA